MSELVRDALACRGWSQKRLAKESGVDAATVSRYLRGGTTPRVENIGKIAEALDLDPTELLKEAMRKGE